MAASPSTPSAAPSAPHLHMSGPRDPTRLCTWRVKPEDLCARLRTITASPLLDPFRFGLKYLNRQQKPTRVCSDCPFLPITFSSYLNSLITFFFLPSISSSPT